jgi:hypothetical protein
MRLTRNVESCLECGLCYEYEFIFEDDMGLVRVAGEPLDRCDCCGLCDACHGRVFSTIPFPSSSSAA